MNSEYLKYFIAACEYGSILEASKNLYISSQGLGQGIHRLEKSIGLELLNYTYNGVKPTEFGELFYKQAVIANREMTRLEELAEEFISSKSSTITVGTIGNTKFYHGFMACIRDFQERYPDSRLKLELIQRFKSEELYANIRNDILDIGLMFHTAVREEFEYCPLSDFSPLMLLISRDHPLAERDSVGWQELADLRYVAASKHDPFTDLINHLCIAQGFSPNTIYYSTENNMNARLLDKNICAMFIRESYAHMILQFCRNTVLLPIEPGLRVSHALFWKKGKRFDHDKQIFIDMMIEYFQNVMS